ncbi:MAG: hypothetical protein AABZ32_02170 [Bacteroidota bacterium]
MKDQCDFPAFYVERIQENILHITIKKVKKLVSEDISQMYACYKEFSSKYGVYVILTFPKFLPICEDAMRAAKKKSNQKYVKAIAYVVSSAAVKAGANFFLKTFKPNYQSAIFNTKSEALSWVRKIKRKSK